MRSTTNASAALAIVSFGGSGVLLQLAPLPFAVPLTGAALLLAWQQRKVVATLQRCAAAAAAAANDIEHAHKAARADDAQRAAFARAHAASLLVGLLVSIAFAGGVFFKDDGFPEHPKSFYFTLDEGPQY